MMMATGSYRTGLMVGFERGLLDRAARQRQNPTDLWMPAGTSDEYRQGVVTGYLKGVTGDGLPDEQLGR